MQFLWGASQFARRAWAPNMRELFRNERLMYSLSQTEDNELILSVVCGGIGMYEAKINLNDEERHSFESEGETFLDNLASSIARDPESYQGRIF